MSIRDMLVFVDSATASEHYLRAVLQLAERHQAHVTGLHVVDMPLYSAARINYIPAEAIRYLRDNLDRESADAEAAFEAAAKAVQCPVEWRCVEGDTSSSIVAHGRRTDMVVMPGTASPGPRSDQSRYIEEVLLTAGRPLLMVPRSWSGDTVGTRITVGWDGSREAARAVADSLPLLRTAESVSVVALGPNEAELPAAEVAQHLARHDVPVTAQSAPRGGKPVGEALLGWAAGQGANLLVMGGYGHSRALESVMGGATRYVLEHATIPVLLSH